MVLNSVTSTLDTRRGVCETLVAPWSITHLVIISVTGTLIGANECGSQMLAEPIRLYLFSLSTQLAPAQRAVTRCSIEHVKKTRQKSAPADVAHILLAKRNPRSYPILRVPQVGKIGLARLSFGLIWSLAVQCVALEI